MGNQQVVVPEKEKSVRGKAPIYIEQIRDQKRGIERACRNIERERKRLETDEKKMKMEIKKMATAGQHVKPIFTLLESSQNACS
jgi:hypothetical protein